jgi:DNA modification methylase
MPVDYTNEEKRVPSYADEKPTVPSAVTHDTPLETLNLNWAERDLPERERTKHVHRLHPYLGKFIPQLVEVFLRKYFSPGETVLDPFVGSGTTLVQANELGINAVGCDISAFNVLLCRAKTASYDLKQTRAEVLDVLNKTNISVQDGIRQLPLFDLPTEHVAISETDNEYLQQWFDPQALRQLLTYREVMEQGNYEYRDLLSTILCRAARSARLTTHFDLDFPKQPQREPYWCYKHSRMCQPTTDALKFLERYSLDTLERIEEFAARRTSAKVTVHHTDSRQVKFEAVDGVITSPPYVGLIDYHEQHAYAYHLLGLQDNSHREIGRAADGSSKNAKARYQQDIAQVFRNVASAVKPGGRIIVVAADKAHLYGKIAEMVGIEVETVIQRHVNRRTGRRAGEFYESIFVWRKV